MTATLTTTLTADAIGRYRQLRRDHLPAVLAYHRAVAMAPAPRYRCGPGEAITFLPDDRPGLAGFTAIATAEHDEDHDRIDLGEYSDTPTEGAISIHRSAHDRCEYFRPNYTLNQRRADLGRCGYARGPAHELALRQVREDARLARELQPRYVHVVVRKAGVLLGEAGLSITFDPDEDPDAAMVEVIDEYGLLDEAIAQARGALLPLIAALAA